MDSPGYPTTTALHVLHSTSIKLGLQQWAFMGRLSLLPLPGCSTHRISYPVHVIKCYGRFLHAKLLLHTALLLLCDFYQPGKMIAKIALCSRVCVFVCVCVRPQLSCALSYVILLLCHYSHERSGSYWKFAASIGQGMSS